MLATGVRARLAWALVLLASPAVAKNEFRPLSPNGARQHCPMAPKRLSPDLRLCSDSFFVVVPCFKQQRTIMQTLLSIWAQACVKHVLVVDDDPQGGHACAAQLRLLVAVR